jgi:hypothetical protein
MTITPSLKNRNSTIEINKVKPLQEFGQRIWLDFLYRNLIRSGQQKN